MRTARPLTGLAIEDDPVTIAGEFNRLPPIGA
jgi:hypothetical protein